eukprot:7374377-Pyramimonas_sp.AAC.1
MDGGPRTEALSPNISDQRTSEKRKPKFSRHLTGDAHRVAMLKAMLCAIPLMAWANDANVHYSHVKEQSLQTASAAFP